jgi:hypothetical protein
MVRRRDRDYREELETHIEMEIREGSDLVIGAVASVLRHQRQQACSEILL